MTFFSFYEGLCNNNKRSFYYIEVKSQTNLLERKRHENVFLSRSLSLSFLFIIKAIQFSDRKATFSHSIFNELHNLSPGRTKKDGFLFSALIFFLSLSQSFFFSYRIHTKRELFNYYIFSALI